MNTKALLSRSGLAAASLGVFLLTPVSEATTFTLQAGSGHPHISDSIAGLKEMYDDSAYQITDGWKVSMVHSPYSGSGASGYWDVPIPLTGTNRNWTTRAYGTNAGDVGGTTGFNSRICSFTSAGALSGCGAAVSIGSASTVLVPTDGTAFAKSFIRSTCIAGGYCGVVSRLYSIKAND